MRPDPNRPLLRALLLTLSSLAMAGCGRLGYDLGEQAGPAGDAGIGNPTSDAAAGQDGSAATADAAGPDAGAPITWSSFDPPTPIAAANTGATEFEPSLSADALLLAFTSDRGGSFDLYLVSRASTTQPFGNLTALSTLNTGAAELGPALSSDGLEILFARNGQIWHATRPSRAVNFSAPVVLFGGTASFQAPVGPDLSADDRTLYFSAEPPGGGALDLWTARRPALDQPFADFQPLAPLNTSGQEGWPSISSDDRELFFEGNKVIRLATRSGTAAEFLSSQVVTELDDPGADDGDPDLSNDGTLLFFASNRTGDYEIYQATRSPQP